MASDLLPVPLAFEPTTTLSPPVLCVDPATTMTRLLELGFQFFQLVGLPGQYSELCHPTSHDVRLWIDSDAKTFTKSYLELESFYRRGASWQHHVFLGDGALQLIAECSDEAVRLSVERCPGLRAAYLTKHTFDLSLTTYLSVWREAVRILSNPVGPSQDASDRPAT